jgi:hypothetical protein
LHRWKKKAGIALLTVQTAGINFLAPEIKRRVVHGLIVSFVAYGVGLFLYSNG